MAESAAQRVQPEPDVEYEKRAGLMAAIRAAVREIGEDMRGSESSQAAAPAKREIHPDLPKVNPGLGFGATMVHWHPFTARELLDTVNEILERTGAVSEFTPQKKNAESQPRFNLLKPV